ncbi:MAG: PAP2 family protein [Streptococcus sp.]
MPKPSLQDCPKFYRWLTSAFFEKATSCAGPSGRDRILTFVMPGIYGLVFFVGCFFEKILNGRNLALLSWIPLLGLVLFSLFRHWVNVPRPYEKWRFNSLLEKKIHPVIPFSKPTCFFHGDHHLDVCLSVVASVWNVLDVSLSLLLALVRVLGGVHYPKDVLVAWGLGLVWGGLFLLV